MPGVRRDEVVTHPRLLTAREVASRLSFKHPETVLRWRRRGEGPPAVKLDNGAIRYPEDELEAWLEERATTPRGSSHPTPLAAARRVGYPASPNPHPEED